MSCSHTCRAMARTAAWDCTSPWRKKKQKKKHRALNSLILHDHTVDATRPATFLLERPQLHKSPDQWLINWWAGVLWVFKWVCSTFVLLTEASLYLYWPLQIAHLWQQSREDSYYIETEIRLFFRTFGHNLGDFYAASTELIFHRRSTHFRINPLFLLQLIGRIGSGKCIKMNCWTGVFIRSVKIALWASVLVLDRGDLQRKHYIWAHDATVCEK